MRHLLQRGKSGLVKNIIDSENNLVLDPDYLKPLLPEAKEGGAFVHDETTDIVQKIIKQAIEAEKPIVFVGNIKNSEKYRSWLELLKKNEYKITVDEVKTSKKVALHRAVKRSLSHQPVPIIYANEAYNAFTEGSELLKKYASRFASYSGEADIASQITKQTHLPNFYKKR